LLEKKGRGGVANKQFFKKWKSLSYFFKKAKFQIIFSIFLFEIVVLI